MIYRVVIIDNGGNEVILTEKNGKRSMEGNGNVDRDIMDEALDKLIRAYQGGEKDER